MTSVLPAAASGCVLLSIVERTSVPHATSASATVQTVFRMRAYVSKSRTSNAARIVET